MPAPVVQYALDDGTVVRFEIEPAADFRPVSPEELVGRVQQAVGPAVAGAKAVLDRVRETSPDEVVVTFGIKVSGTANWLVAKAASEGNFEVTLTWKPGQHRNEGSP